MRAWKNMNLTGCHSQGEQQERRKKTLRYLHGLLVDNSPRQDNDDCGKEYDSIQTQPVIGCCEDDLCKPLVWKTRITSRAECKNIRGHDSLSYQDQVPSQDVSRLVTVKIQDSGAVSNDAPEDRDQKNGFDSWNEKTKKLHQQIIMVVTESQ